jgi:hypothetical protein
LAGAVFDERDGHGIVDGGLGRDAKKGVHAENTFKFFPKSTRFAHGNGQLGNSKPDIHIVSPLFGSLSTPFTPPNVYIMLITHIPWYCKDMRHSMHRLGSLQVLNTQRRH